LAPVREETRVMPTPETPNRARPPVAADRRFTCARRIATILALALCDVAAWSSLAAAHSLPERFEPRRGAALRSAPAEVRILFQGDLEPAFSTVHVIDSAGRCVDKGDARVDERNPRLLRVSLGSLGPGVYRVTWQVLALDGHRTQGTYTFMVRSSE